MVQHSFPIKDAVKASVFGIRHLQCFLLFWGISLTYAMRVNLSLAIVAMTDKKSANEHFPEYSWREKEISLILSSFFWGYILSQLPGGYWAGKFGGKLSILISILTCSILTVLTPLAANVGDVALVCAVRMLQGLAQGILFPATHTLLAQWAPAEERAVLGTYCYSGAQFGTVVMLFASGFMAASELGWPSIFYLSGGLGILWTFAWYYWGASSPRDCKSITVAEKDLIQGSISKHTAGTAVDAIQPLKTPWLKFLSSGPFIALTIVQCAYNWGFWTILTEIPFYMKSIMGFNIKSNASLTALPYLVMFVLSFAFTCVATYIEKHKWLNLTQSRKFFNTISMWLPALALVGLGYVDASQPHLAVTLLIVAVGLSAAVHMGYQVNHIDLSPNFAGIMLATTNILSSGVSLAAPLAVGFIVTDKQNISQWRLVFFIAAGFCFFGNLLFIIFGNATVQPWNEPLHNGKSNQKSTQTDLS